jgi:hypothetical protein
MNGDEPPHIEMMVRGSLYSGDRRAATLLSRNYCSSNSKNFTKPKKYVIIANDWSITRRPVIPQQPIMEANMNVLQINDLNKMDCSADGFVPAPNYPCALTWRGPEQYLPGGSLFVCTLEYGVQEDLSPVVKALTWGESTPEAIRNAEVGVRALYKSMNAAYLGQLRDRRQDYSHDTDHGQYRNSKDMLEHLATCGLRSQLMCHGLWLWVSEHTEADLDGFESGTTFGQWVDRVLGDPNQGAPSGS